MNTQEGKKLLDAISVVKVGARRARKVELGW